jgi:hypothetical protein
MALLGRVPAARRPEAEPEAEAPRLRRADAHPDAPARRPLLARDLGEPLDLDNYPKAPAEEETPFAEAEHRPLPGFLVPQTPEPEPVAEAGPQWLDPEPKAELETGHETEAEPETGYQPLPISELAARLPDSEEEPDQPLSQLVNRIEFGLSRKRQALPAGDPPTVEEPAQEPEKVGHRLRSAINDLQKIASSGA